VENSTEIIGYWSVNPLILFVIRAKGSIPRRSASSVGDYLQ